MGAGRKTRANAATHRDVSIVWPGIEADGYCLIVNGRAHEGTGETLLVLPASTVLHRLASTRRTTSNAVSPSTRRSHRRERARTGTCPEGGLKRAQWLAGTLCATGL